MLDRIHRACLTRADASAFCIGDVHYTYGQLARSIGGIRELLESDFPDEQRVGILAHDAIETYAAILACWFANRTMVPLGPAMPRERNEAIAGQAGLRVVLSAEPGEAIAGASLVPTRGLSHPALAAPSMPRPGDIAYILFTSGSTGVPKGVPIGHSALEAFLDAFFRLGFQLGANDRFLQMFDLTFDLSLMSYCVPLTLGACAYTVPPGQFKSGAVYRLLEEHELTCALMVPSILAYLRPYFDEIRLDHLRYSLFCGEALPEELARAWSQCAPAARVYNVYGPTEATIFCMAYECRRGEPIKSHRGVVSIGRPMEGTGVAVVDEALRPVPAGDGGELCLAGPQLTPGYWRSPERDARALFSLDGVVHYRTGDMAHADADGDLFYDGRLDLQVKIQGFRVELAEIEHVARGLAGGAQVAAVACQDAAGTTAVHLFVEGQGSDQAMLHAALREKLPGYMVPARIVRLDALPLNVNGKIDRPALARRATEKAAK